MTTKIHTSHPGRHLANYLAEYGISHYRLAKDIRVPPQRINEIIHGQHAISADTALRLRRYFGTSAQFWMNLQASYDLSCAAAEFGEAINHQISPLSAA